MAVLGGGPDALPSAATGAALAGLTAAVAALSAGRLGGAAAAWAAGLAVALDGGSLALALDEPPPSLIFLSLLVAADLLGFARTTARASVAAGAVLAASCAAGGATALMRGAALVPAVPVSVATIAAALAVAGFALAGARRALWPGTSAARAAVLALLAASLAVGAAALSARAAFDQDAPHAADAAQGGALPVRSAMLVAPPLPSDLPRIEQERDASPALRALASRPAPLGVPSTILLAGVVLGLVLGGRRTARAASGALALAAAVAAAGAIVGGGFAVRHAALLMLVPAAAAGWSGAGRITLPRLRRRLLVGTILAALLAGAGAAAWNAGSAMAELAPPPAGSP